MAFWDLRQHTYPITIFKGHDQAVNHFVDAGAHVKAVEAAIEARHWKQAIRIVEAMPQDLVSALHILRAAGGDAVRANGEAIPAVGHRGAFIAGAHEFDRTPVIEIINVVKANADLAEGLI